MIANDIRVIVAKSFADIYRENCLQNGLLPIVLAPDAAEAFIARVVRVNGEGPFTVDLVTQRIGGAGGADIALDTSAAARLRVIAGLGGIRLTPKQMDDIVTMEGLSTTAAPCVST